MEKFMKQELGNEIQKEAVILYQINEKWEERKKRKKEKLTTTVYIHLKLPICES